MKIFPDKNNKAFIYLKMKIVDRSQNHMDTYTDENKDWRVYNTILALNTRKLNQINLMDQLKKLKIQYDGTDTNKAMIKKVVGVNNSRMMNVITVNIV
jgi:hypothetical protein